MSTPEFLDLPPGVRHTDLRLSYGPVAALRALPTSGGTELAPAVLVHGFTGSKEDFIALLQSLAQAGREVVAVDLPGSHRSPGLETLTPPPGVELPDYRLSSLGRVVTEVMDQVGDGGPVHLVGHSFGGLVSREAALTELSPLASLTLMCSGPGPLSGQGAARTRNLIAALSMAPTAERLRELWDERFELEARSRAVGPEMLAFLRERFVNSSALALVRMAEDLLGAPDRVDELAEVDVPKLVLYGENDDAWPLAEQDGMAERLGARRLVVPGAGHSPNVEAPETTSSALTSFWNETESVGRR
ncbi:pimeloyl-ACP methyl ester carboxylesterase [Nocardiopsis terrae]|uniref:Pimeloyl-ACP methyl ester carboxylesterase n=1 Tax=Nocardiopsis terrae TaxID=372655 RepID=A0ABR9HBW6_9ACTN|nr:alpha/beta hydrolase [Nocardiopsis terrae]MBE1456512.1 pimeloyl-ACP methyl ester carboxylesterase [Nocardiopsis terrae]